MATVPFSRLYLLKNNHKCQGSNAKFGANFYEPTFTIRTSRTIDCEINGLLEEMVKESSHESTCRKQYMLESYQQEIEKFEDESRTSLLLKNAVDF